MATDISFPKNLQIKINISLILSILVFGAVYYSLFIIGQTFYIWAGPFFGGIICFIILIFAISPLLASLFVKTDKYGVTIEERVHPQIFSLVHDIAKKLEMEMPHEILILPSDEISVSGIFKKRLNIGIVSLRALKKEELSAIIAHEYGHFYGKDTVIGGIIWRIDYSLKKTTEVGSKWMEYAPLSEIAIIGLIAAAFFKIYSFLFNLIALAYSRQVEYRADIIASSIAGKENYSNALANYATFTAYFDQIGYNWMLKLLNEHKVFVNVYEPVYDAFTKEEIESIRDKVIMDEKSGLFSTHPSIKKRLHRIGAIGNFEKFKPTLNKSALNLLNDPESLEKKMTESLTIKFHHQVQEAIIKDAQNREGRCRYCKKQFKYLHELLEHEANCAGENLPDNNKRSFPLMVDESERIYNERDH